MLNPQELAELDNKRATFHIQLQTVDTLDHLENLAKNADELDCTVELINKLKTFPQQSIETYRNACNDTTLHLVVRGGNALLVQWLLENAAASLVNVKNSMGQTPLSYAVFRGNEEIVALLCVFGSNSDAREQFLNTPLDLALSLITLIRNKNATIPGGEPPSSPPLPPESSLFNIVSWLQRRAHQQNGIPESITDFSTPGKAACLPPVPLKRRHLIDDNIASTFYLVAGLNIARYFLFPQPESVLSDYFSANNCTLISTTSEKRMPRQFMAHVLSTILILSLNYGARAYAVLGILLDTRIDEKNFSGALKYFSDRWMEFLLMVKAREHFLGTHPDRFAVIRTNKSKSFPWLSTASIDQLESKKQSGQLIAKKIAAQTSLHIARERVNGYMTTFFSRLSKEQETRVEATVSSAYPNESLFNKCRRALQRDAMPPTLCRLPDGSDAINGPVTNSDKWGVIFEVKSLPITAKAASIQESVPLIEVGTSDGQITEFIPKNYA